MLVSRKYSHVIGEEKASHLAMSEQKEDNKFSIAVTTNSSVQSEDNSTSRIAYKLVRVGDDGSVLPATEDEVMQVESFVDGESILARMDAEANDATLQNEETIEMNDNKEEFSKQEDENIMKRFFTGPEELEAERRRLLARLEVLDSILSKVKDKEQKRLNIERKNGDSTSFYSNVSRTTVKYKRQRRPNPKYLNADVRKELSSVSLQTTNLETEGATDLLSAGLTISRPLVNSDALGKTLALSSVGVPSHICKEAVVHIDHSLNPNLDISGIGHERPKATCSLDNLSIRELHEAFKTTFGRETSVKDKHWLKRQISMGMRRLHETTNIDADSGVKVQAPVLHELPLQPRVEVLASAEQPASYCSVKANDKMLFEGLDKGIDVPLLKKGADHRLDIDGLQTKLLSEKTITSSITGPGSSILCKSGSDGLSTYIVEGQSMKGKRQRKPNRRYIEEEVDGISLTGNVLSLVPTADPTHTQIFSKGQLWPSSIATTDIAADMSRLSSLRSSSMYTSSTSGTSEASHSKAGSNTQRKTDGRAAKLVKMARSARSYQHNADKNFRRVKFKLPKTSSQDKNKAPESYNENTDELSCLLPTMSDQKFGTLQSKDVEHDSNISELVATVPTANGGTRRKHHRPWTLREVMTLVEGVARCGGGKWADIKKLAFSSISYRTAVDLKDKWRNLLRASRSQLHSAKQGVNRKRHFSVSIPGPVLARVRELAALQYQTTGIPLVSATIRSGRLVQRK